MLRAVVDRLRAMSPGVEFALTPGSNAPYQRIAALGAWQRLRLPGAPVDADALSYRLPQRLRRVLRRYGMVTEADVDAVLDASGYAYGAAWGDAPLESTAREIERLAGHGKPYVFLPQAFGPFADTAASRHFGRALSQAALVCARDAESREHLARISGTSAAAVEAYPDFTLAVPGDAQAALAWGVDQRTALIIPNAEMQGPRNPDDAARNGYAPLLQALARRLQELGYVPRVLNHEGAADAALCDVLHAATGGAPVIDEQDPLALKGVIGAAGLVVASRFHGCASALSQAVPCLATAWSHKYGQLFADFGVGEYVLESSDVASGIA
jgi:polysaccharide pyruvyl transferase WcaK-like protein